jgi:hypothetical protein
LTTIKRWAIVRGFCTRWTPVSAEAAEAIKKKHLVKIFSPIRLPFIELVILKTVTVKTYSKEAIKTY